MLRATLCALLVVAATPLGALADAIEASTRQLFGGGTSVSGACDAVWF